MREVTEWPEAWSSTPMDRIAIRCTCNAVVESLDGDEWHCDRCGKAYGVSIVVTELAEPNEQDGES